MIEADKPPPPEVKEELGFVGGNSSGFKLFWAFVMLVSGTLTTLSAKIQFETKAHGLNNCSRTLDDDADVTTYCPFNKPWFSVLEMKSAMSLCLILYYCLGWGKDPGMSDPSWKTVCSVWLPAMLDLLNTVLGNTGLLFVSSSVYQMTRGSVVVFSALLSVKWLGKELRAFHLWAVALVTCAVAVVGLAGTFEEEPSDPKCSDDVGGGDGGSDAPSSSANGQAFLGLGLILVAQLVTAVQIIAEERLMTKQPKGQNLSPVHV